MHTNVRVVTGAAASIMIAATAALPATPAVAASGPVMRAACATHWGSKPRVSTRAETRRTSRVITARAGQHACFDRLVVDLGAGTRPGYRVQYVRNVYAQGTGKRVRLSGRAALEITLHANAVASFPAAGRNVTAVRGFRELTQVASAGSFEGYTDIGVGLRARTSFRVELLKGPGSHSRLVIDIATS
jgi:hypothetical protein